MKKMISKLIRSLGSNVALVSLVFCLFAAQSPSMAQEHSGEILYNELSNSANSGDNAFIEQLNVEPRGLDWQSASQLEFRGHLRLLTSSVDGSADESQLYFKAAVTQYSFN